MVTYLASVAHKLNNIKHEQHTEIVADMNVSHACYVKRTRMTNLEFIKAFSK